MTQVRSTRSWLRTPRRSCVARCGAGPLAVTSHHHLCVYLLLGNTLPSSQFIRSQIINFPPLSFGFRISLICFKQITPEQVSGEGKLQRGPQASLPSAPPSPCTCWAGTLGSAPQDSFRTQRYKPRRATSSVTREQLLSPSTWREVESFSVSRSSFRLPPTHLFQERLSTSRAGRWIEASAK